MHAGVEADVEQRPVAAPGQRHPLGPGRQPRRPRPQPVEDAADHRREAQGQRQRAGAEPEDLPEHRPDDGLLEDDRLGPPVAEVAEPAEARGRGRDHQQAADRVDDDLDHVEEVDDDGRAEPVQRPVLGERLDPLQVRTPLPLLDVEGGWQRARGIPSPAEPTSSVADPPRLTFFFFRQRSLLLLGQLALRPNLLFLTCLPFCPLMFSLAFLGTYRGLSSYWTGPSATVHLEDELLTGASGTVRERRPHRPLDRCDHAAELDVDLAAQVGDQIRQLVVGGHQIDLAPEVSGATASCRRLAVDRAAAGQASPPAAPWCRRF